MAHMEAQYDFFRFFPSAYYSCVLGASKPSPLVYFRGVARVQGESPVKRSI